MVLIYVAIMLPALWGFHPRRPTDPFAGLTIDQSTMIKGIFVLLVFASHLGQYLNLPAGIMSKSYEIIRSNLGQLTVVPFLFFSGYGVRCSIMKKGDAYVRAIPRRRILKTYVQTALILVVFLVVQLFLGRVYSFGQILWAFTLLGSFGNSNWYLFAILFLYAATWISFRFMHSQKQACLLCIFFSCAYLFGLSLWKDRYWYDTIFAYAFGLLLPDFQGHFRKITEKTLGWAAICGIMAVVVLVLTKISLPHLFGGILENIRALCFIPMILAFLSRFQLGNAALSWLGSHVFLCYLLQRLPMIVLNHFDISRMSVPLFVCGSAVGTVLLVLFFNRIIKIIDEILFQEKLNGLEGISSGEK